jgi:Bacterial EndoU nuclease
LQQLETELAAGNDLVETWLGISHLHSVKNNVSFLKELKFAQNSHLPVHLMGEVNSAGNAVGCHIYESVNGINIRWDPNFPGANPSKQNGITRGKIQILKPGGNPLNTNDWITKSDLSSFFPNSWAKERIIEEIALIRSNPSNKIHDRKYVGVASDGITKIEVRLQGSINNLTYNTAFPIP